MSATSRDIHFSVVIADREHWPKKGIKKAGDKCVDDYAVDELYDVMYAAGMKYIKKHPDYFHLDELF